jgi:5-methylcytosine-specific restriction enzyme A
VGSGRYPAIKDLPIGPGGRHLCRECGAEVPKRRRSFCGDDCVDAWTARTSAAGLRRVTFKRDKGVCAVCGLDADKLTKLLRKIRRLNRDLWLEAHRILGTSRHPRRTLWEADHIVPVVENGGECGVDNIRTLCIWCHRQATGQLQRRRRAARAGLEALPGSTGRSAVKLPA